MSEDFPNQREMMVLQQLVPRGITDPATLESMELVPRHLFVPEKLRYASYEDGPLPIDAGQTISQPYIVALMTQSAELKADSKVLEIGTGSGYQAAVLSQIVQDVYTIERIPSLASHSKALFNELGYSNIHAKEGDGTLGWEEHSPFDAILVTAGAPVIPESLLSQLNVGGRMIIPVGETGSQKLLRLRKREDNTFSEEVLELVRFVPLISD